MVCNIPVTSTPSHVPHAKLGSDDLFDMESIYQWLTIHVVKQRKASLWARFCALIIPFFVHILCFCWSHLVRTHMLVNNFLRKINLVRMQMQMLFLCYFCLAISQ